MTDKFVALQGGLDLATPPLIVKAGSASEALNYFEASKGGYTRIAGYERLDGRLSPHKATYYLITITFWNLRATDSPLVVGETLTVAGSTFHILSLMPSTDGTIMEVIGGEAAGVIPTDLFDNPVSYSTHALITDIVKRGADSQEEDNFYLNMAREHRRSAIQEVTGVGPIRGVAQIKGKIIAWRDNGEGKLRAYVTEATEETVPTYAP